MPKAMEEELRREGRKKGLTGDALKKYIYGAMRKRGWRPRKNSAGRKK